MGFIHPHSSWGTEGNGLGHKAPVHEWQGQEPQESSKFLYSIFPLGWWETIPQDSEGLGGGSPDMLSEVNWGLAPKYLDLDLYLLEKQLLHKSQALKLIKTHQRHRLWNTIYSSKGWACFSKLVRTEEIWQKQIVFPSWNISDGSYVLEAKSQAWTCGKVTVLCKGRKPLKRRTTELWVKETPREPSR